MLTPGSLWSRVEDVTRRALRSGHLLPVPTVAHTVVDREATFQIRVIDNLKRKSVSHQKAPPDFNPFLPYEPEMFVGDVTDQHVCLLNKFNVVAHHLLIVTREFEAQEKRLSNSDFRSLWTCLLEADSLGFYNSGTVAGASQPHKHLQLIPLTGDFSVTLEPRYGLDSAPFGKLTRSRQLPFEHHLVKFDPARMKDPALATTESYRCYEQVIAEMGWSELTRETPYNLLVTRRWMLFVPRRAESFASISLNALAFAGSILARHHGELETMVAAGPMSALEHVARPSPITP